MDLTTPMFPAELLRAFADGELVARSLLNGELARGGREECFEELVRRYQRPIAAYAYRLVGDYDAALDLTQEVFIKVYSSLDRYRSEYKFSTWIYKIAHNAAIDHLRRTSSTREWEAPAFDGDEAAYERTPASAQHAARLAMTPEQESERSERRAEIETVVETLPTVYRELIILRHAHDLSYDEIAEITNLPLGTVKNRIFRAREVMREQFVQRGITTA